MGRRRQQSVALAEVEQRGRSPVDARSEDDEAMPHFSHLGEVRKDGARSRRERGEAVKSSREVPMDSSKSTGKESSSESSASESGSGASDETDWALRVSKSLEDLLVKSEKEQVRRVVCRLFIASKARLQDLSRGKLRAIVRALQDAEEARRTSDKLEQLSFIEELISQGQSAVGSFLANDEESNSSARTHVVPLGKGSVTPGGRTYTGAESSRPSGRTELASVPRSSYKEPVSATWDPPKGGEGGASSVSAVFADDKPAAMNAAGRDLAEAVRSRSGKAVNVTQTQDMLVQKMRQHLESARVELRFAHPARPWLNAVETFGKDTGCKDRDGERLLIELAIACLPDKFMMPAVYRQAAARLYEEAVLLCEENVSHSLWDAFCAVTIERCSPDAYHLQDMERSYQLMQLKPGSSLSEILQSLQSYGIALGYSEEVLVQRVINMFTPVEADCIRAKLAAERKPRFTIDYLLAIIMRHRASLSISGDGRRLPLTSQGHGQHNQRQSSAGELGGKRDQAQHAPPKNAGVCYKCNAPWVKGHSCPQREQGGPRVGPPSGQGSGQGPREKQLQGTPGQSAQGPLPAAVRNPAAPKAATH